ncbi:TIGR04222 domain-containing membrane protein [Streptomyces sp. NPDC002138]|uniref:TIGR04222 domain-containing membrane protein n=1 Tax=Streptomyces sp. NPDC002138 TaxID=3154410 RepID=UPI00331B04C6
MIAEVSVAAAWSLVAAAVLIRVRPGSPPVREPGRERPSPVGIGLLRGGARGAAQTALVELYLAGSVEAVRGRMVRRDDSKPPPRGSSGLARAQYAVLFGRLHPRRLRNIERVRRAAAGEARELERAGLMRSGRRMAAVRVVLLPVFCAAPAGALADRTAAPWLFLALLADAVAVVLGALPRRTRRGTALLARLRREHARVRQASAREPEELLLSVALFGPPALRAQLPRFTGESGLLTRPPREPMDRGGGGSGEAFASCGG